MPVTFAKTSIDWSTWRAAQNSSLEYKIGSPSDTNNWYYAFLNVKTGALTYCLESHSHSSGEVSYYKLSASEFKSGIGASNLDLFNNSIGKSNAIKALSVSGKKITYTKEDGTTGTITTQDTTYSKMTGATASAAGKAGLVPAPAAGKQNAFLRGDGTWVVPTDTNTTYSAVTQSANGLMTAADKKKLDGITEGANAYSLPAATSSVLGGVKTGSNITNSSGTISLTKENVVAALGYTPPTADTNTTYSNMTAATADAAGTAGLVPAPVKGAQNYVLHGDGTWKVDANTTYAAMTAAEATVGTAITARSITPKVLGDYVKSQTNDKITNLSVSGKNITFIKGDGTTGTITTQDNNTTYTNMSASELNTGTATTARSISAKTVADYVTGKVSAETTARTSAISLEATNRVNADTALDTRIDNAITAYESADTGLSNRIGSLSADGNYIKKSVTNNVSANLNALDTQLKTTATAVGTETTNRTNADTSLSNRIGSVVSDGTFIKKSVTNDVSANLTALDTASKNAIRDLSVSGTTITFTKGDGTTGTITTQDTNTTYIAMSANELATGTATSSRSITAKVLGDYVKGKTNDKISSLSINDNVITYTKGDGTTGTITTPNTTYSAGSGLTLNGTTLSVNMNGTATSGNTGVVSGGTLYNAIKDKVKYDGNDKSKISFGGTRGTVLSNLLGTTITVNSTDAVTGGQLYAVKQDIAGFAEDISKHSESIRSMNASVTSALSSVAASSLLVDTLDLSKADVSLNNLSDSAKEVLRTFARTAVQEYMAKQELVPSIAPMVSSTNDNTNINTLSITNAGNGSLHVGEGSYVNGTSSIAIGVGNQVNANNSGAFGDPSIINADESYVLGNDDTINTDATGSFIVGNDGVSDAKGALLFGSNTKATATAEDGMALGNSSEVTAKNAVALGSGSIADRENTLSIGSTDLKRKIVNVADGDISQNSSEAVTGAQLFVTNEKVQQNTEALAKKADIDGGNINTSDWASKLGIGKVEDGNADLVTGGTVYDAIQSVKGNELVQINGDVITIGANSAVTAIDVKNANG